MLRPARRRVRLAPVKRAAVLRRCGPFCAWSTVHVCAA